MVGLPVVSKVNSCSVVLSKVFFSIFLFLLLLLIFFKALAWFKTDWDPCGSACGFRVQVWFSFLEALPLLPCDGNKKKRVVFFNSCRTKAWARVKTNLVPIERKHFTWRNWSWKAISALMGHFTVFCLSRRGKSQDWKLPNN